MVLRHLAVGRCPAGQVLPVVPVKAAVVELALAVGEGVHVRASDAVDQDGQVACVPDERPLGQSEHDPSGGRAVGHQAADQD